MAKNFHHLRKEYTSRSLDEKSLPVNPILLFETWMEEAIAAGVPEPTAMNLSTVGKDGRPSARIVLLKEVSDKGLLFFTNFESRKGTQLIENPHAAITFFWPELERQIRLEGNVKKISEADSEAYFKSRPKESRIGAWASDQSRPLADKKILEDKFKLLTAKFSESEIPKPNFWGGFLFEPSLIEFWQGRPNRLHDRILYQSKVNSWNTTRLYP